MSPFIPLEFRSRPPSCETSRICFSFSLSLTQPSFVLSLRRCSLTRAKEKPADSGGARLFIVCRANSFPTRRTSTKTARLPNRVIEREACKRVAPRRGVVLPPTERRTIQTHLPVNHNKTTIGFGRLRFVAERAAMKTFFTRALVLDVHVRRHASSRKRLVSVAYSVLLYATRTWFICVGMERKKCQIRAVDFLCE